MKKVLTIAGSDSSGGAGIQADIKTITVHKMYAMSVITALTAQNTTGVSGILDATPEFVGLQLDSVFTDTFPDSVKIGMVSSAGIIEIIAKKLIQYNAKNIVLNPVMISTSGARLIGDDAINTLATKLIPLASLITPNIPEAEVLCGFPINNRLDMERAARFICKNYGADVLVKGGHLSCDAADLLYTGGKVLWFEGERIDNPNTHGTGCTLSSAIACGLADGLSKYESVKRAKDYITGALKAGLNLGKGSGPLMHNYNIHIK